ncbi:hypothetical protein V6N11_001587 [Hibiscus sabdariffa]|uniref:Uncharacterized protein n=1 Tax=Hibiscus sabdariffa TaxID=183260 RepID=A0ABR2S0E8_9ROSI
MQVQCPLKTLFLLALVHSTILWKPAMLYLQNCLSLEISRSKSMGKPMCDDHDIEDDGVDLEDSLSEGLMERIDMEICFRDRFCILLCLGHRCPLLQRVKVRWLMELVSFIMTTNVTGKTSTTEVTLSVEDTTTTLSKMEEIIARVTTRNLDAIFLKLERKRNLTNFFRGDRKNGCIREKSIMPTVETNYVVPPVLRPL